MTRSSGWPGPGALVSQGSLAFLPSSPDTLDTGTIAGEGAVGKGGGDGEAEGGWGRSPRSRRKDLPPPPSMGTTSMMEEVGNIAPAIKIRLRPLERLPVKIQSWEDVKLSEMYILRADS